MTRIKYVQGHMLFMVLKLEGRLKNKWWIS